MRWDRPTLKQRAKNELRFSYGKSIGAIGIVFAISYVIMIIITIIMVAIIIGAALGPVFINGTNYGIDSGQAGRGATVVSMAMATVMLLITIFVFNPLYVGVYKFSLEAPRGDRRVGNVFAPMKKGNYGAAMKSMFLRMLFMQLGLVVPVGLAFGLALFATSQIGRTMAMWVFVVLGMIIYLLAIVIELMLYYRWCLVPFIVADDPSVTGIEALRRSAALTKGQRWELFVLDLSFLGWFALGALCFGIGVYFVMPYYLATWAQLFFALKGELPEQTMAQRLPPYDPAGFYGQTPQQPQPYAPYPSAAQQAPQPYTPSYAAPLSPPQAPESAGPLYPDLGGGIDRESD